MSRATVLLVATTTGYQIRSFDEAARDLGVHLVIASDRCEQLDDPWRDRAIAVRFHAPEEAVREVERHFAGAAPLGVIAVGDRPTVLAARLAQAFGLPGNAAAAARTRSKIALRETLQAAGVPGPRFLRVPVDRDPATVADGVPYPVVVKPVALSGSRGVMRADTPAEFIAAFHRLAQILQAPDVRVQRDGIHDTVLVESFIPGREYALEGVLTDGVLTPFAIFDKPDPLDGPCFEETIYVTPSRAPSAQQDAIVATIDRAVRALGLRHGPVHAECRVNDQGVYVLEVAARPIGGLCARALRFACGPAVVPLEHVLLRHALGQDVTAVVREPAASGVMMIPIPGRGVFRGCDGVEAAREVPLVEDVHITAKHDAVITPLPEARSYLGFIFARGARPADVEAALRQAHQRLRFRIERELPVVTA